MPYFLQTDVSPGLKQLLRWFMLIVAGKYDCQVIQLYSSTTENAKVIFF